MHSDSKDSPYSDENGPLPLGEIPGEFPEIEPPTTPAKKGIGINELAAKLDTKPGKLRAFLRTHDLGGAGRGNRYAWPSLTDPAVKKIIAAWPTQDKK